MVINLRKVATPNQDAESVSSIQQEVDLLPDKMIEDVCISAATIQSQGHLPLQEYPDGVECEMKIWHL